MSAFVLKIIAVACMLIDHIGAVFYGAVPYQFRWIGRIAFPIFAYLIAQGCRRTRDINKYILRLGIFALISEIPFDLAFHTFRMWDGTTQYNIDFTRDTNVFFTLFLAAVCVAVYEKLKTKRRQWLALLPLPVIPATLLLNFLPESFPIPLMTVVAAVFAAYTAGALCFANFLPDAESGEISLGSKIIPLVAALPIILAADVLDTDYGMAGVALIFALYLVNPENRIARTAVLTAGVAYIYAYARSLFYEYKLYDLYGNVVSVTSTLNTNALGMLVFALVAVALVALYNGKRGPGLKWAFYVFYPAHLITLFAVSFLLK